MAYNQYINRLQPSICHRNNSDLKCPIRAFESAFAKTITPSLLQGVDSLKPISFFTTQNATDRALGWYDANLIQVTSSTIEDAPRACSSSSVVRSVSEYASHHQSDRNGQLLASVVSAGTRAIALTIDNPVALSATIQPDASVASPAQVLTPAHFDAEPIVRPERLCSACDAG
jgi:hypothetical protein